VLCASKLNWKKEKKKSDGCPCLFPLLRGTEWGLSAQRGFQGVWYVVQVCFEGCYVCEDVGEGSMKPCLVKFFGKSCGGVCKHD